MAEDLAADDPEVMAWLQSAGWKAVRAPIRIGMAEYAAPEGYLPYPARGETYTRDELNAITNYLQSEWPPGQRLIAWARSLDRRLGLDGESGWKRSAPAQVLGGGGGVSVSRFRRLAEDALNRWAGRLRPDQVYGAFYPKKDRFLGEDRNTLSPTPDNVLRKLKGTGLPWPQLIESFEAAADPDLYVAKEDPDQINADAEKVLNREAWLKVVYGLPLHWQEYRKIMYDMTAAELVAYDRQKTQADAERRKRSDEKRERLFLALAEPLGSLQSYTSQALNRVLPAGYTWRRDSNKQYRLTLPEDAGYWFSKSTDAYEAIEELINKIDELARDQAGYYARVQFT